MFADDIALYKEVKSLSDQSMLQDDLSQVYEWSCKWQLNLNPTECETICISYKRSPPPASYRLNDHVLSTKSVVRYLISYRHFNQLSFQVVRSCQAYHCEGN